MKGSQTWMLVRKIPKSSFPIFHSLPPKSNRLTMVSNLGVGEYWQGKERTFMIVCLVRGHNDLGMCGFLRDGRRLNVLLSRQRAGLVIVGDLDCVNESIEEDPEEEDSVSDKNEIFLQQPMLTLTSPLLKILPVTPTSPLLQTWLP